MREKASQEGYTPMLVKVLTLISLLQQTVTHPECQSTPSKTRPVPDTPDSSASLNIENNLGSMKYLSEPLVGLEPTPRQYHSRAMTPMLKRQKIYESHYIVHHND
jgi:hypothetical protein